jgi:NhaP-type Na+/H+ or K+/H+ antiporter
MLLAVPIILAATFLTALVMYFVLGYKDLGMSWSACVMFGAIISATDPVAVVAILKTLGVSKSLGTVIEGESLLNDGTALVIFAVAVQAVEGEELTAGYVAIRFIRLSFGGPLLGLLMYGILYNWLKHIHFKPILEVNLTICFAYLTFYIAEHPLIHVSGILAIVTLGLLMTRAGKASISSRSEHGVHTVWSVIGFYAETLIFMLAGIFFGIEMTVDIWVANWWKSIVLYLFLILIRLVLLLITFKPMCWMGYNH